MKEKSRRNCCLILLLLTFSCAPEKVSNLVLLRADSLMECYADSALLLLQNMEHPQKTNKAERALYALLRTQAEDKNYIYHTSDSLIKLAAEYYQQYGTTELQAKVLYYQASVYRDLGDAPRAIGYFQQAVKIYEKQTEHKLLSRIYSQIGSLYFCQQRPKEGMDAYKKFYKHALLADSLGLFNNLNQSMLRVYTELNNIDSTLLHYKEAENIVREIGNRGLEENIRIELVGIYLQLDEFEEANKLLTGKIKNEVQVLLLSELYNKKEFVDSTRYYFQKATERDYLHTKRRVNYELYNIVKSLSNDKRALYGLGQYTTLQDSMQRTMNTKSVKQVEPLYAYQHIKDENNRLLSENKLKENLIYLCVLLFIITSWLIYCGWKKTENLKEHISRLNHSKRQEHQEKLAVYNKEISSIKEQLSQTSILISQEKELLKEKLDRTTEELNKMVVSRQEAEIAFRSSNIYLQIHNIHKNIKFEMTNKHWIELQYEIDKTFNDFTTKLYLLYPKLKQRELYICLLIKAGVSNSHIATLINLEENSVSSIRTRLYEKIHNKKGKAKDFNDFISGL